MKLDQFYTKPDVAEKCFKRLTNTICRLKKNFFYIEPSAGTGAFYDVLPTNRRIGFDIYPNHKDIIKQDFLSYSYRSPEKKERTVVVGNPPFGKRGKTAIAFVNQAFSVADTVAFIVPAIFRKYFVHKRIDAAARLVLSETLHPNSFRKINGKEYSVNTEFQIWTKLTGKHKDKRRLAAPPTNHPDFNMYQYNNTKEALKVFDTPFDFGVPCQGYQDYTRKETNPDKCEKNKQWILFKAEQQVLKRLKGLDYEKLAYKHITTIPGFRKGDVVNEYLLLNA